ncbi:MAG: hypothetical protein OXK77_05685 [Gemmatimonadota bacterium]|nr:hypothetical protein [Gemmatimonadota bacterium]MDE2863883.1 hypothetical protein [Gemmatimonadota bacterium]
MASANPILITGSPPGEECRADDPPGSRAVTVTFAVPSATPDRVTVLFTKVEVTTPASDVSTAYVSMSPSGSLKYPDTSSVSAPPTRTLRSAIAPSATGARLAGGGGSTAASPHVAIRVPVASTRIARERVPTGTITPVERGLP